MHRLPAFLLTLLLVSASGCSLFGSEDTLIVATGHIVLAETGAPVAGLGVTLYRAAPPLQLVAASTATGADGRFRIEYDPGEDDHNPHELIINVEPYDSRYIGSRASYVRGETRDLGDVVVRLTPTP